MNNKIELSQGTGSWSNVAEIVRLSFAFVFDKLKHLSDRFSRLETQLSSSTNHLQEEIARLQLEIKNEREARLKMETIIASLQQHLLSIQPHNDVVVPNTQAVESLVKELVSQNVAALRTDLCKPDPELFLLKNIVTSEMLVARWAFTCDRGSKIDLVETVNTSQRIFKTQLQNESISISTPGIYQLNLATFSSSLESNNGEPVIQLVVNDQIVFTNAFSDRTRQKNDTLQSKKSSLVGWSVNDFVSIPSNDCQVSIRIRSHEKVHGLLNLRNVHCF